MSDAITITVLNSTTWEVTIPMRGDFHIVHTVIVESSDLPAPLFPTSHMIAHVARSRVSNPPPKAIKARSPKARSIPSNIASNELEAISDDIRSQSKWTKAHDVCQTAAQQNGISVDLLADTLPDAYSQLMSEFELIAPAKLEAHNRIGLTVKQIEILERNGTDYSNLSRFDDIASNMALEFPELGWSWEDACSQQLWDLLHLPMPKRPTQYGQSTVERAVELLTQRYNDSEIEFAEWNPENDVLTDSEVFTEF